LRWRRPLSVTELPSLNGSIAISSTLLSRSWLFRFATTEAERAANPELGRERWMGLGSFCEVGGTAVSTDRRAHAPDAILRASLCA
jgi:hypothetical protein